MADTFGFVTAFASFLSEHEQRERVVGAYVAALGRLGGARWAPSWVTREEAEGPFFVLVATGGTESVVMELRDARRATYPDEPVLLIAHPGNNSLPAALEVLARLQQEGARGRIFYLSSPDDAAGLAQIEQAVQDLAAHRALSEARIGLIGRPSDWLVASTPDPAVVRAAWGPEVIEIAMSELGARIASVTPDAGRAAAASLVDQACAVVEPTGEQLQEVGRVSVALQELAKDYALDALTLRCFDLVLNQQTTGCFGLAELTDAGVIAGCEGDLVSTVGLLWAYVLLGEVPWMANPAQLDEAANSLWLAHCTVPRKMVESYTLRSHFESGLGVGIQGTLPEGAVTLLRIGGTAMDKLWLAEGRVLRAGDADNLCRTQAEVALSRGHVTELLRAPLGNHLVLIPGHHADRLMAWWKTGFGGPGSPA